MDVQNVTLYAGSLIKSCLMLTLQGSFKGWKHSELLKKSDNFRHFSFIFVFSHNDSFAPYLKRMLPWKKCPILSDENN